jgi:hypothetical protein
MIRLHARPLSRQQADSLSQSSYVSLFQLTDGIGGGRGRAWSRIIRSQESLALYKSSNPLCLSYSCLSLTLHFLLVYYNVSNRSFFLFFSFLFSYIPFSPCTFYLAQHTEYIQFTSYRRKRERQMVNIGEKNKLSFSVFVYVM